MPYVQPGMQRFDIRLPDELARELRELGERSGKDMRQVIEETIRLGLAEREQIKIATTEGSVDAGQLAEALRTLIREDIDDAVKRQGNRLAAMMSRCMLEGGIAWRLMYGILQRIGTAAKTGEAQRVADDLLDEARTKASKALARSASAEPQP